MNLDLITDFYRSIFECPDVKLSTSNTVCFLIILVETPRQCYKRIMDESRLVSDIILVCTLEKVYHVIFLNLYDHGSSLLRPLYFKVEV